MPIPNIASFFGYLFRKKTRVALDHQAMDEMCWRDRLALPRGLEIEWLGTSGFALRCDGHTVLIDPYVTRVPLSSVVTRRRVAPDTARISQYLGQADAVLIGHAHFDHALDTPAIAQATGCTVYGSRSTAALLDLYDLGDQRVLVEPYTVYEIGPFEVTFVPSLHSKLVLGLTVPYRGDISCEHFDDLTPNAYRCGDVYGIHIRVAGISLYHQGSAELIEDAIRHSDIDIFLAGIAGRGYTRNYLGRILPILSPRVIVPHHFDDFFKPLDAPLEMSFNVNLAGFIDEVKAVSSEFQIAIPQRLTTLSNSS